MGFPEFFKRTAEFVHRAGETLEAYDKLSMIDISHVIGFKPILEGMGQLNAGFYI
jgi:hypothetical protein